MQYRIVVSARQSESRFGIEVYPARVRRDDDRCQGEEPDENKEEPVAFAQLVETYGRCYIVNVNYNHQEHERVLYAAAIRAARRLRHKQLNRQDPLIHDNSAVHDRMLAEAGFLQVAKDYKDRFTQYYVNLETYEPNKFAEQVLAEDRVKVDYIGPQLAVTPAIENAKYVPRHRLARPPLEPMPMGDKLLYAFCFALTVFVGVMLVVHGKR